MIPDLDERRAKRKENQENFQREVNNGELSKAYHGNPDGDKPMTVTETEKDQTKPAEWSPNA